MKQSEPGIKKTARLLEAAAKKRNESADAACSAALYLDRLDGDLGNEMLDSVFEAVTELARVSLEGKPNYERAARELIAKLARETARAVFRKRTTRK